MIKLGFALWINQISSIHDNVQKIIKITPHGLFVYPKGNTVYAKSYKDQMQRPIFMKVFVRRSTEIIKIGL